MKRLVPGLVALAAACASPPEPAVLTVPLQDGWHLQRVGDLDWISARVPGTVHTDLLEAGLIADPFVGDVESELRWIEDETWRYHTELDVDRRLLDRDRVELVFEGLDTFADVRLNGQPVLTADNMFRTWRLDVGRLLRAGRNELEVTFRSPTAEAARRAASHPWPIPHQEPDETRSRAFVRKAAYHFGWDWGPRYVTSGIWRPARLEAWSGVRIRDVRVGDPAFGANAAEVEVLVEVEASAPGPATVGAVSPSGAFEPVLLRARLDGGVDTVALRLRFPDPRRWWPAGLGEAFLYEVDVDVASRAAWDHRRLRVGLRTLELVTEPDSVGETFFFRVNGRDFFARGANLVPPDHFEPRADSAAYARLLDDAVAANMNMVRVWGGGVYPPDVFYDLADERGILVWQDFMFANALVPGDSAFAAAVTAEATDQVRRLRVHPSLALWCGNNEIAEGWANWGWRDAYSPEMANSVEAAYRHLFEDLLASVVERHDGTRAYWPSSPSIGWGHAESLTRGDSHYWGVWWGMEPFRTYAEKPPRFASEFGFQALPDPETWASFDTVPPRRLDDPVMRSHQRHPAGFQTIREYLEREWPVPPPDSLDAFGYVSQLAQAEGVGLALEAHRRSWPRTGGSLFWQLNDTWPVVSWSSRDHFGHWKALHYRSRALFAPVSVLADAWADTVRVWVVSDGDELPETLTVRLLHMSGTELAEDSVPLERPGLVWTGTVAALLPEGTDPADVVVVAAIRGSREPGGRDLAFLVPPKDLVLPDPDVRIVGTERDGEAWQVTLQADRFAFGVRLAAPGRGARYSENYMHLLPNESVTVRVEPEDPGPDSGLRLTVRSLADLLGIEPEPPPRP